MADEVDRILSRVDRIRRRQIANLVVATERWADLVLGEAQRIVPLEEGTLAATGDRDTTVVPRGCEVVLFFSTVYAQRQHEELDWKHLPGRQAKYLEEPFKRAIPRLPRIHAAACRAALR